MNNADNFGAPTHGNTHWATRPAPNHKGLSTKMANALDQLESAWTDSDENDAPCLAWTLIDGRTVAALIARGFPIFTGRDYHGPMARMANPHPSGLW